MSKGDPDSRGAPRTQGPSSLQKAQTCAQGAVWEANGLIEAKTIIISPNKSN